MARNRDQRLGTDPGKGQKTREEIVSRALQKAAMDGLGAISIGVLAKELGMSKSGLFAHFGSKENLEAAIVERARDVLSEHIVDPIEKAGLEGVERVWALCEKWLEFVESRVLPGSYFFTGAFFQCAGQRKPIPRKITQVVREWIIVLREAIAEARRLGEINLTESARNTALELNSILIGVQWSYLMGHSDREKSRSAILHKLASLATDKIPDSAFESLRAWRKHLEDRRASSAHGTKKSARWV